MHRTLDCVFCVTYDLEQEINLQPANAIKTFLSAGFQVVFINIILVRVGIGIEFSFANFTLFYINLIAKLKGLFCMPTLNVVCPWLFVQRWLYALI